MRNAVDDGRPARGTEGPLGSVFEVLRPTPRVFVLAAVSVVTAATVSAREVERFQIVADSMGGAGGVGVVGILFSLVMAVVSVAFGRFADVLDARWLVGICLVVSSVVALSTGAVLFQGPVPAYFLIVTTVLEGVQVGLLLPSYSKIQAALVHPDGRGAAEILNALRSGIGGLIGVAIAAKFDHSSTVLIAAGVAAAIAAVSTAVVIMPVRPPRVRRRTIQLRELIIAVRSRPPLMRTVRVELVFAFVLPTQLIALAVADGGLDHVRPTLWLAALFGALIGRLVLSVIGLRGDLAHRLRTAYLAFIAATIAAALLIVQGPIPENTSLMVALVVPGCALLTIVQGVSGALQQQQVPEEIRGSLTGAMNFLRYVLIAAGAAITARVTQAFDSFVLVAMTAFLAAIGFVLVRGFRGVGEDR